MKILWLGDAVASTGFARCTHAVCEELVRQDHEVSVLGLNYFGDPHDLPYDVYPCRQPYAGGFDAFGRTRLPHLVVELEPDLIVLLTDPWHVEPYMEHLHQTLKGWAKARDEEIPIPPVVGWIAVDAENHPARPLNALEHLVTWTDFADRELRKGGYEGTSSVVPLGVDTDVFKPLPQADCRLETCPEGFPLDAFIVGVVGRNQERKRLDLTIQYFADWIHGSEIEDAYLYLHVAPTAEDSVHLPSLVRYYGLQGKVLIANPPAGNGSKETDMPFIYNSFDVYFTTTQGEGWGLPCLEAMACGVPVIVPDYSGLGSWVPDDAGIKVPCTGKAVSAPVNAAQYTVGGIMDRQLCKAALDEMYRYRSIGTAWEGAGQEFAQHLTWDRCGKAMVEILEEVHARPEPEPEKEEAA